MRIGQNQPRIGNGEHPLVSWGTVFHPLCRWREGSNLGLNPHGGWIPMGTWFKKPFFAKSSPLFVELLFVLIKTTCSILKSLVDKQGLVTVPFWEYWTSPYSSHGIDHIPIMVGWCDPWGHLMTHDKCLNHHSFPPCQPQVKRATALAGKGGVAAWEWKAKVANYVR